MSLKTDYVSRGSIHRYKNLNTKLHNRIANIYFNKQCRKKKLVPSYAKIRIPRTSPAHKHTQQKVASIRIKDEIRYLHCKKQQINHLQLHLSHNWDSNWPHLQEAIETNLHREARSKYSILNKKLDKLSQSQTPISQDILTFYP
jgi:hypothetical protein